MPISDSGSYPEGHFKRVYEYIIKPSCIKAGFNPLRADDILNTSYIAIDVLKRIISSDMAICDISSRNPNVFYELGIRQAFNRPVTLIRDSLTERVFDIQGFRDIEYDENLRIDNVEVIINSVAETLMNTHASQGNEINSLISLLGIHSAKITNSVEISKDTELILNSLTTLRSRLTEIEKLIPGQRQLYQHFSFDGNGGIWKELSSTEKNKLVAGNIVEHLKFGKGKVIEKGGTISNPIITVLFEYGGEKKIMLNYVNSLKQLVLEE